MNTQKKIAAAFLALIFVTFLLGKHFLQQQARHLRNNSNDDPRRSHHKLSAAIESPFAAFPTVKPTEAAKSVEEVNKIDTAADEYPEEGRVPLMNTPSPSSRRELDDVGRSRGGQKKNTPIEGSKLTDGPHGGEVSDQAASAEPFFLDLHAEARIAGTSACPLPALHPDKFAAKMGWGIRKPFAPCTAPNTTALSTLTEEEQEPRGGGVWLATLSFNRLCTKKSAIPQVYAFDELPDAEFSRMKTVFDAESRQNDLKEKFAPGQETQYAHRLRPRGGASGAAAEVTSLTFANIRAPYVLVLCDTESELHVREVPLGQQPNGPKRKGRPLQREPAPAESGALQNVLHVMFDSTSLPAFRRGAKKLLQWLEATNNDPASNADVFTFKHYHAVSCCSPGNQIPMYSGNINGEGDPFVRSEPWQSSTDWLWNIASALGFKTFWSLDNCPDKSARDYHAFPSVDSRVVAPLCLAGVLLSHTNLQCLHGKTVDEHVVTGLESFWKHHSADSKFAAVQFITPHEETEKQLIELDALTERFFKRFAAQGELNRTAVILWSDHGINFGKYASTHDGEIEKIFPFVHLILPRWFASGEIGRRLRQNQDRLSTPYDMYEAVRHLLYHPQAPPPFRHDDRNPPRPKAEESHIIASFPKDITPLDPLSDELPLNRSCWEANIPMEFCTCIPFVLTTDEALKKRFVALALKRHKELLEPFANVCEAVELARVVSVETQQWPTEYKPKGKDTAKSIWMKPNRDMVKVTYNTNPPGAGLFEAVFSVEKADPSLFDLAQIDRLDAMTKKCGLVERVTEQLCVCK